MCRSVWTDTSTYYFNNPSSKYLIYGVHHQILVLLFSPSLYPSHSTAQPPNLIWAHSSLAQCVHSIDPSAAHLNPNTLCSRGHRNCPSARHNARQLLAVRCIAIEEWCDLDICCSGLVGPIYDCIELPQQTLACASALKETVQVWVWPHGLLERIVEADHLRCQLCFVFIKRAHPKNYQ